MTDYEKIESLLGEWGPFQKSIFFLLSACFIPQGYMSVSMVFLSATPPHHCALPRVNDSVYGRDINQSVPYEVVKGEVIFSRCTRYKERDPSAQFANETEGCLDGWVYSEESYTSTVVTEWNLVCDDAWKAPFSASMSFMGVVVGSFLSGQISDRFGRKLVFFVALISQTVFSLLQAASNSWELYCVLYFLGGIVQNSSYVAAFVLGSELLGKSTRVLFSTVGVCVSYALGYACLPLFAYFIRDWSTLLVALALPGFLYIPLWWFVPESPRWLLSQGRVEEAEAIVRAAAKKNGMTEAIFRADDCSEQQRDCSETQRAHTYLDLVKKTNIRNVTILNAVIWIITSTTYYGISLNTPNMGGDAYLNCFVSAATEIVAYVATWLFMRCTPRRFSLASLLLSCGVMLPIVKFVPSGWDTLILILVMSGKMGVTAAYCFIYVYSTELFPTVLRNTGLGAISTAAHIGTILCPYIAYMGEYYAVLPYILMGSASICAGFLSLLLPETKDSELPEFIDQVKPIRFACADGLDALHEERLRAPTMVESSPAASQKPSHPVNKQLVNRPERPSLYVTEAT